MPGIKGFSKDVFPAIRINKMSYEILRKLRFVFEVETMDGVISNLLISSRVGELDAMMPYAEDFGEIASRVKDGYYSKTFKLADTPSRNFEKLIRGAISDLNRAMSQGQKDKVVIAMKDMVANWNAGHPEDFIKVF